jgi:predicted DNA-binding transcriptional regulator AlpA
MDIDPLPEPLCGIRIALAVRGCKSPTTIWSDIREDTFPRPDKIIKGVRYWKASTLRRWQDSNIGDFAA